MCICFFNVIACSKKTLSSGSSVCFISGPNEPFDPREGGFRQLWELYEFVTGTLGQTPVVIDADDMCNNPGD